MDIFNSTLKNKNTGFNLEDFKNASSKKLEDLKKASSKNLEDLKASSKNLEDSSNDLQTRINNVNNPVISDIFQTLNDNQQVKDKIVISDLDTNLDLSTINSIANLLLYRETFPISSILYKKKGEKYIKEATTDEEKEPFNINNIFDIIKEKHKELKKNLEDKKGLMNKKMVDASQSLLDDDKQMRDTQDEKIKVAQKQNWDFYMRFGSASFTFITTNGPAIIEFFSNNTGSSIKTFFSIFFGNWTNVFAGFVIVGSFIIFVTILSSNKKSDNNKLSRRNSSSTTENNFTIQDYLSNSYDSFSSFTKRMNDNVTAVSETISSVTTATPDDITRIKLDNGRGADNLYHFNGKDLNKMNFKKGIYDENSVYSIYKPIDIKIKDFNIKWKSEKEENNNKYVFDCEDTSMKDYFDKDCTARTYDIIVTDKDNICVEPI